MLLYCVIFTLILRLSSTQQASDGQEETNQFFEAAKSFIQEATQNKEGGLGGLLQNVIQSGAAKPLGDILSKTVANSDKLSGDQILGGLASLFAGQAGVATGGGAGGLNSEILSQLVSSFMQSNSAHNIDQENEIPSDSENSDSPINWESLMGIASNFVQNQDPGNNAMQGFLNLLPMLTNSFTGNHAHFANSELEDSEEHKKHEKSTFIPPFMRIAYEYWDHFKESELGRTLWKKSGMEKIFNLFIDSEGYFQIDRIFESMENISFRKRWIKSLSNFVAQWLKHILDPATQSRYLSNIQVISNGFLKAQGYPKSSYFDPSRPSESLSILIDAVAKKQFGLKVNSATYIKPAVDYIQDVLKLGQSRGLSLSHLSLKEVEVKLSEAMNGEVIEPMLRVWRVYKYVNKHRNCDRQLICALNDKNTTRPNKIGLQPAVTKVSSLFASWYISGRTGTPFWKLYNAATEEYNCLSKYPEDCKSFYEEDIKVTTEYYSHADEL